VGRGRKRTLATYTAGLLGPWQPGKGGSVAATPVGAPSVLMRVVAVVVVAGTLGAACSGGSKSPRHGKGASPTLPVSLPPLPAAAVVPTGSGDTGGLGWLAAQMAAKTNAQDERPLILAALHAAGFVVDAADSPAGPHGAATLDPWEVDLLAGLEAAHLRFPLDNVRVALATVFPNADTSRVDQTVLDVITAQAAQSADPNTKSWAQLIMELARYAPPPENLATASPAAVSFDGVQMTLILRTLAAGLVAHAAATTAPTTLKGAFGGATTASGRLVVFRSAAAAPSAPCSMPELIKLTDEVLGKGWGVAWGKILEQMGADAVANGLAVAGAIVTYAKLLAALLLLKLDVTLVGEKPLLRTLDQTPGETRTVHAHAYFDTQDSQYVNCAQTALASLGLDFNIPEQGGLAGAQIFVDAGASSGPIDVKPSGLGGYSYNTDENGDADIEVVGKAVDPPLEKDAPPFDTSATIYLQVRPKAQLSAGNDLGGLLDAILTRLDPTGVVSIPAEIALHSRWFAPTVFTLPVTDHVADYKVDYQVPSNGGAAGPHLHAVKCGGPGGDWTFTADGTVPFPLGPATITFTYSGAFKVTVSKYSSTGTYSIADIRGQLVTTASADTGDGQITADEQSQQVRGGGYLAAAGLVVHLSLKADGTVTGPSMSFSGISDGTVNVTIPVQRGVFCKNGQPTP